MRISCSSCVMADLDLRRALARMQELGFKSFDLFALESIGHVWPSRLIAGGGAALKQDTARAILDSGLEVSSVNCSFEEQVNDPDPAARLRLESQFRVLLDLAEEVSAPLLTLQTGGYTKEVGRVEAFDRARQGLRWLAGLAEGRKVRLSFEPHWGAVVERPADALYLARQLWPDVAITYDPSHFAMQPDIQSLAETEPLLDYTIHVHVRSAAPGEMQAPMSEGRVDFPWLVSALEQKGYGGALAIEYLDSAEADAIQLRDVLLGLGVPL